MPHYDDTSPGPIYAFNLTRPLPDDVPTRLRLLARQLRDQGRERDFALIAGIADIYGDLPAPWPKVLKLLVEEG
jgi:hypothetical protein